MAKKILQKQIDTFAVTGTASFYSTVFNIQDAEGYSMQVDYSNGSITALATVQGTNNQTSWADINNEAIAVTGTSGTLLLEVSEHSWGYTRLKLLASAGSGNLVITTLIRSNQD